MRQLSRAVEQSPAMILLTNAERRIEYANPRFTSVTGYEVDEILGDKPDILKADNVSSEAFEEVWRAVEAEGEWSGVLINRKKNGNFFWAETHISAITDGAGKVVNYLTTAEDVTERREKEARLAQAEKMQALGGIASGIAHNINNMLLPIIALTEMTMKGLTPEDRNQKRLSKVLSAAHQAKDLVASILTFGREEDVRAVPLNLRETVAAAVALVRSLAPSSVTICENFGEEALTVRGVAGDIQTIIMNLTGNAIDALRGEVGEIEIRLCRVEPDAIELKATPGLELVPHARLTVADTGIGIPPETLDKIFQPFFTTKAVGRGAGLGLSVVNGIVKDYGGGMRVESAVGQGSTFHVYLPLYLSAE
ncbi:MAG: hypothetical protein A2516_08325 [Alphaproteobacteria bacterium RIFOXYD12_FULL_60_8]|nr:MAG: hypothetical protein A2516_08325 [Alphaproteobacteria bacterium RIFOXYD12_FULL_60_8]